MAPVSITSSCRLLFLVRYSQTATWPTAGLKCAQAAASMQACPSKIGIASKCACLCFLWVSLHEICLLTAGAQVCAGGSIGAGVLFQNRRGAAARAAALRRQGVGQADPQHPQHRHLRAAGADAVRARTPAGSIAATMLWVLHFSGTAVWLSPWHSCQLCDQGSYAAYSNLSPHL